MAFNFLHFIFSTHRKVSVSKYPCKLMDVYFFSFLLHLTCKRRPSLACTYPPMSFLVPLQHDCKFYFHAIYHLFALYLLVEQFATD